MEYNINNNNLASVFLNIKKELKESSKTINELLELDYKCCKANINIKEFENILNKLQYAELEVQTNQKVIIIYSGNPYITLNLCILAILTNTTIILDYNDFMLGTNAFIVKIVNDVLNLFKTNKLVYLRTSKEYNEENVDKIICIDDINKYNTYVQKNNTKAKFYSFKYIDFYSDTNEFEDITELIYKYAENNQIFIESYSELEPSEAAEMIQKGLGTEVIVLTTNEDTKKIFESKIHNKKIYINQNPFKQETKLINKEILYM